MAVKKDNSKFITGERVLRVELDTEDLPTNVRKAVADVILELVDRLLTQVPDDTKSLSRAINVGSTDCSVYVCAFLGLMNNRCHGYIKSSLFNLLLPCSTFSLLT